MKKYHKKTQEKTQKKTQEAEPGTGTHGEITKTGHSRDFSHSRDI